MAATAALVFAGKSVATPAISFIVKKAFGYLREWHQAEGMEKVKDRLERRLIEIQAVYDAVSLEQIDAQKGCALDQWLWRFRDAVEGAEDALDEVEYYKLEEEAHRQNLQHQIQVCIPVTRFFRDRVFRRFVRHTSDGNMVKKLRKAIQDLDGVAEGVSTFLQLVSRFDSRALPDRAESSDSSAQVTTDIFGRNKEKEEVMMWLTNDVDEVPDNGRSRSIRVPVFAIIGIGGIGKTTLAQLVCREGSPHFDTIVWVHVSDNTFSATRITKKILEAVTSNRPNADSLEALQQLLKEQLNPKKFLLILDDVWEDRRWQEWEKLMAPLQTSQSGSRVLLTTRMQSVADIVASVISSKMKYLHLCGLDEDANFTLFQKVAFKDMQAEDYSTELLEIAKKTVMKFQGCPLVTKMAAAYLKENISEQYWENLGRKLEMLKGNLDDIIMTVLRSSYRHLPENLQLCYRYCSIFPKCYVFKKDELVKMWMGSGLIPQVEGGMERPEDIGERYLAQLTRKSFFSFVPTGDPYSKCCTGYYIMHDLLHDLARSVSFGECLRLDEPCDYVHHRHTVRHLWVAGLSTFTVDAVEAISFFKNLRTLVIESSSDLGIPSIYALERVVNNLKSLRLLILKGVPEFCFAKEVANKHLRYISFSGMQKVQGLSKLYHLQILNADRSIEMQPEQLEKIGNLSRLRYVSYGSNGFGEFSVLGLTSLQELHDFHIQDNEGYQISSLRNLSKLSKLNICNLENARSREEIIEAKLNEKSHLRSLSLKWSGTNSAQQDDVVDDADDRLLDQLEPHTCLEKLEMTGYSGVRFPSWFNHLSLKNVVLLELRSCGNWVCLPAFGNLQLLKHLELQKLTELEQIGIPPYVLLPKNLKTLVVEGCQRLSELPLLPPSLVQLELSDVRSSSLPRIYDQQGTDMGSEATPSSKLVSVIIRRWPELFSLEGSFLLQERYVRTLRILNIVDCLNLTAAPLLFGEMKELSEFRIGCCYEVTGYCFNEFEGFELRKTDVLLPIPNTLKEPTIMSCGDLQVPLLHSVIGLTNLTSLNLCNCNKVKSLPSSNVFACLQALREIFVTNCSSLECLCGIETLAYLTWLEIRDCPSLRCTSYNCPKVHDKIPKLKVCSLWVRTQADLRLWPLSMLCNTKNLIITIGYDHIPDRFLRENRVSLESLEILKPDGKVPLNSFCSLKRLEFDLAPRLREFPILPYSLECLIIRKCGPELERYLLSPTTNGRNSISHIRHARLGITRL